MIEVGKTFTCGDIPMFCRTVWRGCGEGFNYREEPSHDEWSAGTRDTPNGPQEDGHGELFIKVAEILQPQTTERLAIYYRWYVDPDGGVFGKRRKIINLSSLRRFIKARGMTEVANA